LNRRLAHATLLVAVPLRLDGGLFADTIGLQDCLVPRPPIHVMLPCYVPIISDDMAYLGKLSVADITTCGSVLCGPRCWAVAAGDDAFNMLCVGTGVNKQVPRCVSLYLGSAVDEVRIRTYRQLFHPKQVIFGACVVANNLAHGHYAIDTEFCDSVLDQIQTFTSLNRRLAHTTSLVAVPLWLDGGLFANTAGLQMYLVPRPPSHFMLSCHGPIISEDMAYLEKLSVAYTTICESVLRGPCCWTVGAGGDAFNMFCAGTCVDKQVPRCVSWDSEFTADEVCFCTYRRFFHPEKVILGTGVVADNLAHRQYTIDMEFSVLVLGRIQKFASLNHRLAHTTSLLTVPPRLDGGPYTL